MRNSIYKWIIIAIFMYMFDILNSIRAKTKATMKFQFKKLPEKVEYSPKNAVIFIIDTPEERRKIIEDYLAKMATKQVN
jgi:hypothetical protein